MMRFYETVIVLICGFIMDFLLGDPERFPHPIIFMGKYIKKGEDFLRSKLPNTKAGEFLGGSLLTLSLILISFLLSFGIIYALGYIHTYVRIAAEIFFCWQILAARSLAREAVKVRNKVNSGDLEKARSQVSRIVGRDTENLTMKGVIKACIETVAESTSDGVIAPMFFIALGGIPLGFLYKAVNTLDSMVGYKSEKYINFGKFPARLDDILNYIPSRLTALSMIIVSPLIGLSAKGAWNIWRRDGRKHLSPNSGNPEAACAGALGIELGGDASYFGKIYKKNPMGDPLRKVNADDISSSVKLMYLSSLFFLIVTSAILVILGLFIKD